MTNYHLLPNFEKVRIIYRLYKNDKPTLEDVAAFAKQKIVDISDDEIEIVYNMLTMYGSRDE
jgi:hypothetical protein